jgi:predicted nucleotidyltransferase
MPVRSLNSSVFKWPDLRTVEAAVRAWAEEAVSGHPEIIKLGYFGSYARGNWGVGSDLDVIAIVCDSSEPFERRALDWDLTSLPVPADLLVYSKEEWGNLIAEGRRFACTVEKQAVWVYEEPGLPDVDRNRPKDPFRDSGTSPVSEGMQR